MAAACLQQPGGMLAEQRGEASIIKTACQQAEHVWPANTNGPCQTVLAGTQAALATVACWQPDLRVRAIPLLLAGGFHSPLMAAAQPPYLPALAAAHVLAPELPVIRQPALCPFSASNIRPVLAALLAEPTCFALELAQQLPLRVAQLVALGPKPVLSKKLKRIARCKPTTQLRAAAALKAVAD